MTIDESSYYDEKYEEPYKEESCHYGFGDCLDDKNRDQNSCLGCELLYPKE